MRFWRKFLVNKLQISLEKLLLTLKEMELLLKETSEIKKKNFLIQDFKMLLKKLVVKTAIKEI